MEQTFPSRSGPASQALVAPKKWKKMKKNEKNETKWKKWKKLRKNEEEKNEKKWSVSPCYGVSLWWMEAWVTRPERPKGVKDEVKQARMAAS